MNATLDTLNDVMEIDHVIRVHADGSVTDANDDNLPSTWAPEVVDFGAETYVSTPWSLMTGYTGQHGYNGPVMHTSEFVGGRLAEDILATPGLYVAVEVRDESGSYLEDGPIGWAVAYQHD